MHVLLLETLSWLLRVMICVRLRRGPALTLLAGGGVASAPLAPVQAPPRKPKNPPDDLPVIAGGGSARALIKRPVSHGLARSNTVSTALII